jgi:HK97 family phage prohead protease
MRFVESCEFKALHLKRTRAGLVRSAPLAGLRKSATEDIERVDERTLRFTISTGIVDRDMDTVAVAGWQLDNFARNPVVLWAHRADAPPIGKAIDFGRDDNRLFSAVQFIPGEGFGDAGELAEEIYRLYAGGFLAATSVGFRPIKWDVTEDKDRGGDDWFPGLDFHEQELVELSLVSVPSNPDALIEPGGDDARNTAPVLIPAPVPQLSWDQARRRARAAMLGAW